MRMRPRLARAIIMPDYMLTGKDQAMEDAIYSTG